MSERKLILPILVGGKTFFMGKHKSVVVIDTSPTKVRDRIMKCAK